FAVVASGSLRAAVEEPGGTDPDPLPQGHLDRRLRGRADRIAREGRQRALGLDYWTHARWSKRDLSAKRYIYFWVDGIHVQARLEDTAQCLLIIIGATPEGRKELVGLTDGVRESAQSWRELLLDLKRRGLSIGPELAVADGALGFWQAVEQVWPQTRGQRCWVHKTANVLNKLPKSQQPKAKRALQEI